MKRYRVTFYFSRTFEVEAENEAEAEDKADDKFKSSFICLPIPDEEEIECLDDGEEEEYEDE